MTYDRWICVDGQGRPVNGTLRDLRENAIRAAVHPDVRSSWRRYRRQGWRCVQCQLTVPEREEPTT